jgi:hypothetical protein
MAESATQLKQEGGNSQERGRPSETNTPSEISSSRFYDVEPISAARLEAFRGIKKSADEFAEAVKDRLPVTEPFPFNKPDRFDITERDGFGSLHHRSDADRTTTLRQLRQGELVAPDGSEIGMDMQERIVIDKNRIRIKGEKGGKDEIGWIDVKRDDCVDALFVNLSDPTNPARVVILDDNRNCIELREKQKQEDGSSRWGVVASIQGRTDSLRQPEDYLRVTRDKGCNVNLFDFAKERLNYLLANADKLKPAGPDLKKAPAPTQSASKT